MATRLIWIPSPRQHLTGGLKIEPGYPRDYTVAQMRQWAHDAELLEATSPKNLEEWAATPPEKLSANQRRVVESHRVLNDPGQGIVGDLREDGVVEVGAGRHRTAYMIEQGIEAVPVWVKAQDPVVLRTFAEECQHERDLGRQGCRDLEPKGSPDTLQRQPLSSPGHDPISMPERKPIATPAREPVLLWRRNEQEPPRGEEPTR
jgi:hypothetical protein